MSTLYPESIAVGKGLPMARLVVASGRAVATKEQASTPPQAGVESPLLAYLRDLHALYASLDEGDVATYIPELAKADPADFGICAATADGRVYAVGDSDHAFSIQSISKAFVFGLALEDHGRDELLRRVGVEPTGDAFNSIILDEASGRPFNPMINAGAIATASLVRADSAEERIGRILDMFSRYTGHPMTIDEKVFLSERETGDRNRAIAYLMRNFGMIEGDVDDTLDVYFQQCSILVTAKDLALMAATLANNGINPVTGTRAIEGRYVENVLSVMNTCGMYDYAGEWTYKVGMPAKSGVAGGILTVLPGQLGIAVYSPRLDKRGNSVRGIRVCSDLSAHFGLHFFSNYVSSGAVVRRDYDLSKVRSKRVRPSREHAILNEHGEAVRVFELQGLLYFGAMELLIRRVTEVLADVRCVVLDMKRVTGIDAAGGMLLKELVDRFERNGTRILMTYLQPDSATRTFLEASGLRNRAEARLYYHDTDTVLEQLENLLISEQLDSGVESAELALDELDIVEGLDDDELEILGPMLCRCEFAAGEEVFREGEPGDAIYFLARGTVSVRTRLAEQRRDVRLATLGPGVAFGEMAILSGGNSMRSADVCADEPMVCYKLPVESWDLLGREHPRISQTLFRNLAKELSDRLRTTLDVVRALER